MSQPTSQSWSNDTFHWLESKYRQGQLNVIICQCSPSSLVLLSSRLTEDLWGITCYSLSHFTCTAFQTLPSSHFLVKAIDAMQRIYIKPGSSSLMGFHYDAVLGIC